MGEVVKFKKIKIEKFACPYCHVRGKHCPEWVIKVWPSVREFESWSIAKKNEWLKHHRHLS